MEINITEFFKYSIPSEYSASVAELGEDAGTITWQAAIEASDEYPLLKTQHQLDAFREYAAEFGAWDEEEIAKWSPVECNALLVQMISGDIRETGMTGDDWDWEEYDNLAQAGQCPSNIFLGDDGEVYYYIGV